ncbi:MAG: ABC transporter permease, partial [Faecousia sp.]
MWLLLKYTLLYAAVLILVALGGMFSERSGVINIALEGIMVIGGLMGVVTINIMNALGAPVFLGILVTVIASALAGLIYSSLLAFSAINLKADQTIGGTALNLLATALATVIAKRINGSDSPKIIYSTNSNAVLNSSHFSFNLGPLTLNWFLLVTVAALAAAWFILYRSRFGMRLMACGEHPQAADSVGINVYKMRWAGVLMSGILGGIGGMAYIVPAVGEWNFEMGVAG